MCRRSWLVPLAVLSLGLLACDEELDPEDFFCDELGEICGPIFCSGDRAEIPVCERDGCVARFVTCPEGTRCGASGCRNSASRV